MAIEIPYGKTALSVELDSDMAQVLHTRRGVSDPVQLALAAPLDAPALQDLVRPGDRVVVVTSDVTRPCPSASLLPPVVDAILRGGVRTTDIEIIFGLGKHRPHSEDEQRRLAGSLYDEISCMDSDPKRTVRVGTTSRGTPVEIFKPVAEADVRVAIGCVEPHYFAGYSGGHKALVPGVASEATIAANHSMMVAPSARAGVLDGNPVRDDIEEAGALARTDFILNVVVDGNEDIVAAVAGHPITAHRSACRMVDHLSRVEVEKAADVVVVSAGGHPKDINLYQAQKALSTSAAVVRDGGTIIWVAECPEGFGNPIFEDWFLGAGADAILARFAQGFVLGGHKAAAIAKVLRRAQVVLISEMAPETVRACGMIPRSDLRAALDEALTSAGPGATLIVLPSGASVLATVSR